MPSNFKLFCHALTRHPGVPWATIWSIMFVAAGYKHQITLCVAVVGSVILWTMVLYTAWQDRILTWKSLEELRREEREEL